MSAYFHVVIDSGVAGMTVTIVGDGFIHGSMVLIGGTVCTTEGVVESREIVCIVGDHEFDTLKVDVFVPGVGLSRSDVTFQQTFELNVLKQRRGIYLKSNNIILSEETENIIFVFPF